MATCILASEYRAGEDITSGRQETACKVTVLQICTVSVSLKDSVPQRMRHRDAGIDPSSTRGLCKLSEADAGN